MSTDCFNRFLQRPTKPYMGKDSWSWSLQISKAYSHRLYIIVLISHVSSLSQVFQTIWNFDSIIYLSFWLSIQLEPVSCHMPSSMQIFLLMCCTSYAQKVNKSECGCKTCWLTRPEPTIVGLHLQIKCTTK